MLTPASGPRPNMGLCLVLLFCYLGVVCGINNVFTQNQRETMLEVLPLSLIKTSY